MLKPLLAQAAMLSVSMPPKAVLAVRDKMAATPSLANATVSELKRAFTFGIERGLCAENPARDIKGLPTRNTGATPWPVEIIEQYFATHKPGSDAHLALGLLLYTACRIGDLRVLGYTHERIEGDIPSLRWKPQKSNAGEVHIPMLPPLIEALNASGRRQETPYLVRGDGAQFASADALGARFRKWCHEAGIEGYSAHGVRKAVGSILADAGCTQYEIMAIHGHSQPQTSARYTRGANRWRLAQGAMCRFSNIG